MLEALERLGLEDFEDELSGVDLLALARDGRLAELKKPKGPLSKADATRATKQLKQLMSEGVLWRCWTDGRRGERDHFAAYTAENSAILEAAFQEHGEGAHVKIEAPAGVARLIRYEDGIWRQHRAENLSLWREVDRWALHITQIPATAGSAAPATAAPEIAAPEIAAPEIAAPEIAAPATAAPVAAAPVAASAAPSASSPSAVDLPDTQDAPATSEACDFAALRRRAPEKVSDDEIRFLLQRSAEECAAALGNTADGNLLATLRASAPDSAEREKLLFIAQVLKKRAGALWTTELFEDETEARAAHSTAADGSETEGDEGPEAAGGAAGGTAGAAAGAAAGEAAAGEAAAGRSLVRGEGPHDSGDTTEEDEAVDEDDLSHGPPEKKQRGERQQALIVD